MQATFWVDIPFTPLTFDAAPTPEPEDDNTTPANTPDPNASTTMMPTTTDAANSLVAGTEMFFLSSTESFSGYKPSRRRELAPCM